MKTIIILILSFVVMVYLITEWFFYFLAKRSCKNNGEHLSIKKYLSLKFAFKYRKFKRKFNNHFKGGVLEEFFHYFKYE